MVDKNNLDLVSFTLARPSNTAAMDVTEYNVRLCDIKKQRRRAESKINSYTEHNVSSVEKDKYDMKLEQISDKVEAMTDKLDNFIIDAEV